MPLIRRLYGHSTHQPDEASSRPCDKGEVARGYGPIPKSVSWWSWLLDVSGLNYYTMMSEFMWLFDTVVNVWRIPSLGASMSRTSLKLNGNKDGY